MAWEADATKPVLSLALPCPMARRHWQKARVQEESEVRGLYSFPLPLANRGSSSQLQAALDQLQLLPGRNAFPLLIPAGLRMTVSLGVSPDLDGSVNPAHASVNNPCMECFQLKFLDGAICLLLRL